MKQSSHESPDPAQPAPGHGTAHVDDIDAPEGEETAPQLAPQEGWTVIAEEDTDRPHPQLAAEMVLLVQELAREQCPRPTCGHAAGGWVAANPMGNVVAAEGATGTTEVRGSAVVAGGL